MNLFSVGNIHNLVSIPAGIGAAFAKQIYLLTYLWPSLVNIDASVNKNIINGMQFQNYIYHLDVLGHLSE